MTQMAGWRTPEEESAHASAASTDEGPPTKPGKIRRIMSAGGSMLNAGLTPENFSDALCLTFDHVGLDGKLYELFPGGSDHDVEFEHRREYAGLRLRFAIDEMDVQIDAIRAGLAEMVPARLFFLLRWDEMAKKVCGTPIVDVQLLKDATVYTNCSASSPRVKHFWDAIDQMSHAERSQFL